MKVIVKAFGESESDTEDLEDCKYINLGLVFGAGIDFCKKFKVEIKYELGLSRVFDDSVNKQYNLKNSLFSICFAYHN